MQLQVQTVQSSFQQLKDKIEGEFDAVFCLGNSLPHLLSTDELKETLQNFYSLLNPDGMLFIQLLNYERILFKKERIQSIKEIDGTTFVRFYDFGNRTINFNILKIQKTSQQLMHTLESIELNPMRFEDINEQLYICGFSDIQKYGSLTFEKFSEENSRDLVLTSKKLHTKNTLF